MQIYYFFLNKKIILYICRKYIFMQLVKKTRGRPKMAAKDKRVPITVMVKATKAKELRQLFIKLSKENES
jgi:hypothetical protein